MKTFRNISMIVTCAMLAPVLLPLTLGDPVIYAVNYCKGYKEGFDSAAEGVLSKKVEEE